MTDELEAIRSSYRDQQAAQIGRNAVKIFNLKGMRRPGYRVPVYNTDYGVKTAMGIGYIITDLVKEGM